MINQIKEKAKNNKKTIILPESFDVRVLKAGSIAHKEGIANIIFIGDEESIKQDAIKNHIGINGIKIINPKSYEKTQELIIELYNIRKEKGMNIEEAEKLILTNNLYFSNMLVKMNLADGIVSGAATSSADVLRPALQIIKCKNGIKKASSFFLMTVPNCEYGYNGTFIFSDCGMNRNPTVEELAEIANLSSESFELLTGKQSIIAMLSHSTFGSSNHPDVDKVVEATKIAKENYPQLLIDGELQLDAAIVPDVADLKAPNSSVAGKANTLIFPDLDAGNIGYKLTERLAKAIALGPITQGLDKPINDLSRGCTYDDIVGVIAITAIQCK